MYDFRNHGNSKESNSEWIIGKEERLDVLGAINYISNHPNYKDASIGLLSICMGAVFNFRLWMEKEMKSFQR